MNKNTTVTGPCKIVVVGGGRSGEAIMELLHRDERYEPVVAETDYNKLRDLRTAGYTGLEMSGSDLKQKSLLKDACAVICAAHSFVAPSVARAAAEAGCHYIDMCEDVSIVEKVRKESEDSEYCSVSGCGLAPGLVSAIVEQIILQSPVKADITAYVGVLPAAKTNRLGYGNMWDIDGLIAEYTKPCSSIENGEVVVASPLQRLEQIEIGGVHYEAFTTSGSIDELVCSHKDDVARLVFKTLRYPGHLDYMQFLLDDLGLSQRLYSVKSLLLNGLPNVDKDRIIIHVYNANGETPSQTRIFEAVGRGDGSYRSAISTITARHVCSVLDVITQGLAPSRGVLHHSELTLDILKRSPYARGF